MRNAFAALSCALLAAGASGQNPDEALACFRQCFDNEMTKAVGPPKQAMNEQLEVSCDKGARYKNVAHWNEPPADQWYHHATAHGIEGGPNPDRVEITRDRSRLIVHFTCDGNEHKFRVSSWWQKRPDKAQYEGAVESCIRSCKPVGWP